MIIKPRIRGFICTTAHPVGLATAVRNQIDYSSGKVFGAVPDTLVLGCSAGYGLASRCAAAFGGGARTLGVSFEKAPDEKRTGSAGWYANRSFDAIAAARGHYARTIEGDAFSDALKAEVADRIAADFGQIGLLVYSLAAPVRTDPDSGETFRSAIKPMGEPFHVKTLNVDKQVVHDVTLEPAEDAEIAATVKVMGGEDWERWIDYLAERDLLAPGFRTVAYTYIGSELTWPIYWHGTLGRAKEDLDRAAVAMRERLAGLSGDARVAVLKAVVTQASAAIPVVPLYNSLLFRVMKDQGQHEEVIEHVHRLFAERLFGGSPNLDDTGRIRMDERELSEPVQAEVSRRWPLVSTENLAALSDFAGFRSDFLKIFGFEIDGVDYDADVDIQAVPVPD